jgi:hypothetical protein
LRQATKTSASRSRHGLWRWCGPWRRSRGGGFAFLCAISAFQILFAALALLGLVILLAHISLLFRGKSIVSCTMKSCRKRFNVYLVLGLGAGLLAACHSTDTKMKKEALSTFRVYIEARRDAAERSQNVTVGRSHPVSFSVEKDPFLSERNIKEAKVVNEVGGFAIQVQFDRQGTWLFEQYTTANKGKHLAILSQFPTPPDENLNEGRWLAAPRISNNVTNGLLSFTPDTTREEAEQIVLGLTHVAKHLQDDSPIQ